MASRAVRPHPHLYQISALPWTVELSGRHGKSITLATVPDTEWDALSDLGFDFVYLTGVWQRSAYGRYLSRTGSHHFGEYERVLPGWQLDDVVGSPFAVQAYAPEPALGGWEGLASARAKLDQRGIGLVLDYIPNHTGVDHPWISAHPDFYVHGTHDAYVKDPSQFFLVEAETTGAHRFIARGRDPYFPAWEDTAQLNYASPALRAAMLDQLRHIGAWCDGLRCDMAMLLLNDVFARTWGQPVGELPAEEFWALARAAVPDLVLIAEVYWGLERRLLELGFDYTYDKQLYDAVMAGAPAQVRERLQAEPELQQHMVRFLENHDEPRARERLGDERVVAAAALHATVPGMRFYHHGQLQGRRIRLPVRLRRIAEEEADADIEALHQRLLALTNDDDFHGGAWQLLDADGRDGLVAYTWAGKQLRVVVVNLSDWPAQARLSGLPLPGGEMVQVTDELHGGTERHAREALERDGLQLHVAPHGGKVLTLTTS